MPIPASYLKYNYTRWLNDKESACQCGRHGFNPWVGKIPWRRKWEPTPVFLLGKSHVQRSLRGYSPWGCKRVGHDLTTEHTRTLYNSYHSGKAVLELARHISLVKALSLQPTIELLLSSAMLPLFSVECIIKAFFSSSAFKTCNQHCCILFEYIL